VSATRGQDGLGDGFDEAQKNRVLFLQGMDKLQAYAQGHEHEVQLDLIDLARKNFDVYYNNGVSMAKAYVEGVRLRATP
jgi:methyl-accepting chemotaxis protein